MRKFICTTCANKCTVVAQADHINPNSCPNRCLLGPSWLAPKWKQLPKEKSLIQRLKEAQAALAAKGIYTEVGREHTKYGIFYVARINGIKAYQSSKLRIIIQALES